MSNRIPALNPDIELEPGCSSARLNVSARAVVMQYPATQAGLSHCHQIGAAIQQANLEGEHVRVSIRFCLAFLLLLSASPLFARASEMTLYTASSEPFTVYVSGPKDARTGVVLVHDWFGVSPFYANAAERLAKQGYGWSLSTFTAA